MEINNNFDHIAFATRDTDKSIEIFSLLGFNKELFYKKEIEKFNSCITKLQSISGQVIELVEPSSEQSVVRNLLKDKNATIYHSAFLTSDLMTLLVQLRSVGAVLVTEPMEIPYPATDAHHLYKTCHIYHPNIGLFEITGPFMKKN